MFSFYDKRTKKLCIFLDIGEYKCYDVKAPIPFFRSKWIVTSPSGEEYEFPSKMTVYEILNFFEKNTPGKVPVAIFLPQDWKECPFFIVSSPNKGTYLFAFEGNPLPQNVFAEIQVSDRFCLSKQCVRKLLGDKDCLDNLIRL